MLKWENYRHKNVVGQDCHLVAVVNAYSYLTGKLISEQEYEEFVDLSGCRYGTVIKIEPVLDRLGMRVEEQNDLLCGLKDIEKSLPLQIVVWHPRYGFHGVLVIDYEGKTDSYRVLNFDREATSSGWIYGEKLMIFNYACDKNMRKIEAYKMRGG